VVIDIHAHLYPADYLDLLRESGVDTTGVSPGLRASDDAEDLAHRFALMDEAGVDLQILSCAPQFGYLAARSTAVDAARLVNDRYATLVREHPGRFRAFATLPLPHLDAARAELERALDELDLVGVVLGATIAGVSMTDSRFDPLWAALERRGALVLVHPVGDGAGSPRIDGPLRWLVGAPVEDTIAAAELITGGHLVRYPAVRIVNSHLGGALPLLLDRWDSLLRFGGREPALMPADAARRMWFDTVSHGSATALHAGIGAVGVGRLVMGSDYPFQSGRMYTHGAVGFITEHLDDDSAYQVLDRNARGLLGTAGAEL
jgi:aminocarboxymuconate-semialdehyde decarboxylase